MDDTIIATPTDGSNEEFVTVASFPDPAGANLARMALETAGIEAYMHGETANSLLPVAFMARLQVRPGDARAAREVLESAELTPESMESVTAAEMAGEGDPL